ncbi:hypothetical protein [Endozoicomonas atrinae]|uniref:hypothetical protein n=1 Tax=Endozoicomonas atrinae TaxID=1333660 RepID=UPI003AFF90D4
MNPTINNKVVIPYAASRKPVGTDAKPGGFMPGQSDSSGVVESLENTGPSAAVSSLLSLQAGYYPMAAEQQQL